ncbi:cell division cycle-associated protein 7-like [Ostrea edulis]|uniref:cell division cycle-associated protein 7-like n=1 Tax=Ostrea edulis TaxID=37623 RepID=UPI002094D89D|nr:cell division cycle-associated protein 7-like [Ostrea edulis]
MLNYEDIRAKNLEDNKAILEKLMAEVKWHPKQKKVVPRFKTPHKRRKSETLGPIRRNPSRKARCGGKIGQNDVDRHCDPVKDSDTSPTNWLKVRFGFFHKKSDVKKDSDDEEDDMDYKEDIDELDEKLPKSNYTKSFQLDTRSAEEITEDDLALVAVHVSEKRYDSIYGTSCHQCRQKTADMKTICRSGFCFGVRGQFCGPCLRNRYGEDAKEALKNESWHCPPCKGICNCSFCRKKQGKSCTGIMIHLARHHGFESVKDYLQSLSMRK